MNNADIKLSNFERLVINGAEQKRDIRLAALAKEKKAAVEKIKRDLEKKFAIEYGNTALKIKKLKNERIFQCRIECQQQVLQKRRQLIDSLFENVAKMLEEFAASDNYRQYLIGSVSDCKKYLDGATGIRLFERDKKYAPYIEEIGLTVEYTKENIIGGFMLIDEKNAVRIDNTLITKLKDAKDKFLERYNVKI